MSGTYIYEGLRSVSATSQTLVLLMEEGAAIRLQEEEITRMLTEIAMQAPGLLHAALEERLVRRIVSETSA